MVIFTSYNIPLSRIQFAVSEQSTFSCNSQPHQESAMVETTSCYLTNLSTSKTELNLDIQLPLRQLKESNHLQFLI